MLDWFHSLIDNAFMPHGHCFLWRPGLLWFHVLSDGLTALAYFSIPAALIYLVRRRRDLVFGTMFWMFAGFILFCGLTHVIEAVAMWWPIYYTEGAVKAATGAVSAATAVSLWFLIPQALALPSAQDMRDANERLREENAHRRRVEEELRRANERLEARVQQRTEELEHFVYAASHDLQEPLRQIRTYSEFLTEDAGTQLGADARDDLYYIRESSERASARVEGLLSLSRVGRRSLKLANVDVGDCLRQALSSLRGRCDESGAEVGEPPSRIVRADPPLLTALYENLIDNAIKCSRERPVIRFTAEERHGELVLGVADEGIGVDPAYQNEILKPFYRLHVFDHAVGLGVGLSVCERIVRRHGGRLSVESTPGEGAHFRFTLRGEEVCDDE